MKKILMAVLVVGAMALAGRPAMADTISGCCGDSYSLSATFESGNTWDVTFTAVIPAGVTLYAWSLGFDNSVSAALDPADIALENGPVSPGGGGCQDNVTHTACLDGLSLGAGTYTWVIDVTMASGFQLPDTGHIQTYGESCTEGPHGLKCEDHNLISLDDGISHNVPEPGSMALFGAGLLGMAGFMRRKLMA